MQYVAMFDEVDEATAIFKCSDTPPSGAPFVAMEGLPSDHYLRLAGAAANEAPEIQAPAEDGDAAK